MRVSGAIWTKSARAVRNDARNSHLLPDLGGHCEICPVPAARNSATISRIQQTQKTDAYKKAGGTPIQFHRLVPTGLAGCSSSRARRLFQGQRQKEVRRQGGVPRRLGGGGSGIECRILLSRGLKQSDGSRGTSKSLKRIIGQDLFWSP